MFTSVVAAGLLTAVSGPPLPVAPPPREVPPKRAASRPSVYRGFVVAVDAQSITVRGAEVGLPQPEVIRRFMAGAALLAGEQDREYNSAADYRLKDVRVGDRVYLMLRQDVPDVCATVRIERRPGGVVPPAPWWPTDAPNPHHEYLNAWQAFEEKGTPLPEKYDPVVQQRKFEEEQRIAEAQDALRRRELGMPPAPLRPVAPK